MNAIPLIIRVAILLAMGLAASNALSADLATGWHARHISAMIDHSCRHNCRSVCPDRYSCGSLYGPYGGVAYWTRYTSSGWGYYR